MVPPQPLSLLFCLRWPTPSPGLASQGWPAGTSRSSPSAPPWRTPPALTPCRSPPPSGGPPPRPAPRSPPPYLLDSLSGPHRADVPLGPTRKEKSLTGSWSWQQGWCRYLEIGVRMTFLLSTAISSMGLMSVNMAHTVLHLLGGRHQLTVNMV